MRTFIFSAALLTSAVPLLGAAPPIAGSANHPVQINSCGPMSGPTKLLFGIPVVSTSSGIQIQFTNESPQTATLINFAVDSNGSKFVIRDVGTFSPGIEITHQYSNGAGQAFVLPEFVTPKIKCAVDSVRFADGTIWRHGDKAKHAAAASSAPDTLTVAPAGPLGVAVNGEARLFLVQSSGAVAAFSERDTCAGIAKVTLAATGENSATYSVAPLARGSCSANISDENGSRLAVAVNVQ